MTFKHTRKMFLVALFILLSTSQVLATIILTGYENIELRIFEKPVFHGKRSLRSHIPEIPFYVNMGRTISIKEIEEINGKTRSTYYTLRNGIYFGEYKDRRLTKDRGFLHFSSVILTEDSKANIPDKPGYKKLAYVQSKTNFIWENRDIVAVHKKLRQCTYTRDGSLKILSEWQEGRTNKKSVTFKIVDMRKAPLKTSLYVSSYGHALDIEYSLHPKDHMYGSLIWTGRLQVRNGEVLFPLSFLEDTPVVKIVVEEGRPPYARTGDFKILKEIDITESSLTATPIIIEIWD